MKAEKTLTVSVSAYNVEKTINETLSHFMTLKNLDALEVLVINDGSTDGTADIVSNYVNKYPDVYKIINKENGGWGSTLNTGIDYATGKYFKQLDGDDYFDSFNLDFFLEYLKECNADLVYSPFIIFDDKTGGIIKMVGDYGEYFDKGILVNIDELEEFIPAMHSMTVKTDILQKNKIRITENSFYTDLEYVFKAYNTCYTMTYFSKAIYYYRIGRNGQSMSVTGIRKHYIEHQNMLFSMIRYIDNNVTKENIRRTFLNGLEYMAYMQYLFYMVLPCSIKNKKELISFDTALKRENEHLYEKLNIHQPIRFWRGHKFVAYYLLSHLKVMQDKKRRINVFEGG